MKSRKVTIFAFALFLLFSVCAYAATWNGIEPLKSTRADVEKSLGRPVDTNAAGANALEFKVAGGTATIAFVDKKFVENKKLNPALEGTVLQIILQHANSKETPQSLKLEGNQDYIKEPKNNVATFRNLKDGIYYTFVDNTLRTTRYSATADELKKAQR